MSTPEGKIPASLATLSDAAQGAELTTDQRETEKQLISIRIIAEQLGVPLTPNTKRTILADIRSGKRKLASDEAIAKARKRGAGTGTATARPAVVPEARRAEGSRADQMIAEAFGAPVIDGLSEADRAIARTFGTGPSGVDGSTPAERAVARSQLGIQAPVREFGSSVAKGFASGITRPLRFAGIEAGKAVPGIKEQALGRLTGQILGEGATFVGLAIGTGAVGPLAGAARTLRSGGTLLGLNKNLSTAAFEAARGAVAGSLIELGATEALREGTGESVESLKFRFPLAVGLGAVADAGVVLGLGALQARGTGKVVTEGIEDLVSAAGEAVPQIDINPLALKLEEFIHPNAGLDRQEMILRFQQTADPDPRIQLQETVARVGRHTKAYGAVELPRLTGKEVAELQRAVRALPEPYEVMSHNIRRGNNKVVMSDGVLKTNLESKFGRTEKWRTYKGFLDDSTPGPLRTRAESVLDLLKTDIDNERVALPDIEFAPGTAFGDDPPIAQFLPDEWKIRLNEDILGPQGLDNPEQSVSSIIHEYTHALTQIISDDPNLRMFAGKSQFGQAGTPTGSVSAAKVLGTVDDAKLTNTVRTEMKRVTEEIIAIRLAESGKATPTGLSTTVRGRVGVTPKGKIDAKSRKALRLVLKQNDYYNEDSELMSRLVEMMFLDMKAARRFAPTATRLMGELIEDTSPKLRMIIHDEIPPWTRFIENAGDMIERKVQNSFTQTLSGGFERAPITPALRKQFADTGVYDGMPIFYKNKTYEAVGVDKDGFLTLRDPATGKQLKRIRPSKTQLPTAQAIGQNRQQVLNAIKRNVTSTPRFLGLKVLNSQTNTVANVNVPVSRMHVLEGTVTALRKQIREVLGPDFRGKRLTADEFRQGLIQLARSEGKEGVLLNDRGIVDVYLNDPKGTFTPDRTISESSRDVVQHISGSDIEGHFRLNQMDMLRSQLGESGIPFREIEYYATVADQLAAKDLIATVQNGDDLIRGMGLIQSPEVRIFEDRLLDDLVDAMQRESNGVGSRAFQVGNEGQWAITLEDGTLGGVFNTQTQAENYLTNLSPETMQELNALSEMGTLYEPLQRLAQADVLPGIGDLPESLAQSLQGIASHGARPNENLAVRNTVSGGFKEAADNATQFLTGMANIMRSLENQGMRGIFTEFFRPIQQGADAMLKAKNMSIGELARNTNLRVQDMFSDKFRLSKLIRPDEGGVSLNKALDAAVPAFRKLSVAQKEQVSLAGKALSRWELDTNPSFMGRVTSETERQFVTRMDELGQNMQIPELTAKLRRMLGDMESPETALEIARRDIALGRDVGENRALIQAIERTGGKPTLADMADLHNVATKEELDALIELDRVLKLDSPDEFDLGIAMRRAEAIDGLEGKTGRELVLDGADSATREMADHLDAINAVSFMVNGRDSSRMLRGLLPMAERFDKVGIVATHPLISGGALADDAARLVNKMTKGEVYMHDTNAFRVAQKNVHSNMVERFLDPIIERSKPALRGIAEQPGGERALRLVDQVTAELRGAPHQSYQNLADTIHSMVNKVGNAFGANVEFTTNDARWLVQSLLSVGYKATIPLRPDLLIRNFFELSRMMATYGFKDTIGSLKFVTGPNRKAAFAAADRAGAIRRSPPLHGVDENRIVGALNSGLKDRITNAPPAVRNMMETANRVIDVGFDWYQGFDDLGRAAAFFTQGNRVDDAFTRHLKPIAGTADQAKIDTQWAKFMEDSKLLTFDPQDQATFVQLYNSQGLQAAKDYIGKVAADNAFFRYGHANHAAGWGGVAGKLFGQFGTWPVQYKDWLLTGLTRGTTKDRMQFAVWNTAFTMMPVVAAQQGYDLRPYSGTFSMSYSGGPFLDATADLYQWRTGMPRERAAARRSLGRKLGVGNPLTGDFKSIFVPGSYSASQFIKLGRGEIPFTEVSGLKVYEEGRSAFIDNVLNRL